MVICGVLGVLFLIGAVILFLSASVKEFVAYQND